MYCPFAELIPVVPEEPPVTADATPATPFTKVAPWMVADADPADPAEPEVAFVVPAPADRYEPNVVADVDPAPPPVIVCAARAVPEDFTKVAAVPPVPPGETFTETEDTPPT